MNAWLDSLESLTDKNFLKKFEEIYYLGSTKPVDENSLKNTISDGKLKEFLIKNEADVNEDLLDFFLLVNEETQDLIVIYSPFDLLDDERIYLNYEKIEEDLSSLPDIDVVK